MRGDHEPLSAHFSWAELLGSDTAARRGIDNAGHFWAGPQSLRRQTALRRLADEVLEPLRAAVARPVLITSGYRCPSLNRIVGGAPQSAHMQGRAADLVVPGLPLSLVLIECLRADWPIDRVILEHDRWLHVQVARPGQAPRRQAFRAARTDGQTVYTPLSGPEVL